MQYLRPGFNLSTLNASGTTIRFFLSYGGGDTFEELEPFEGSCTTGALMRGHATDGPVENLRRSAVMERARLFGVDDVAFVEEIVVPELLPCY